MFCVAVTFQVAPDDHDRLVDRTLLFADASRREPGCDTFQPWSEHGQPGAIFLYEIYADRAAFDAHLAAPHFQSYNADIAPYLITKNVVTWDTQL